jgi:hypothetical protein
VLKIVAYVNCEHQLMPERPSLLKTPTEPVPLGSRHDHQFSCEAALPKKAPPTRAALLGAEVRADTLMIDQPVDTAELSEINCLQLSAAPTAALGLHTGIAERSKTAQETLRQRRMSVTSAELRHRPHGSC